MAALGFGILRRLKLGDGKLGFLKCRLLQNLRGKMQKSADLKHDMVLGSSHYKQA